MKADLEDRDFVEGIHTMLGLDEDAVEKLIDQLDADQLTNLADAVANNDKSAAQEITDSVETDEDVSPLFRGTDIEGKEQQKKRRKVSSRYQFSHGDDVQVEVRDPETHKVEYQDGTIFLPHGPGKTVGVKIEGKAKMVDRHLVHKLEEGVLGMVGVPNLQRIQQLAGIPQQAEAPVAPAEISVEAAQGGDDCAVAQAMAALDALENVLPNVRLADLKNIRQRIIALQTTMNESADLGREKKTA